MRVKHEREGNPNETGRDEHGIHKFQVDVHGTWGSLFQSRRITFRAATHLKAVRLHRVVCDVPPGFQCEQVGLRPEVQVLQDLKKKISGCRTEEKIYSLKNTRGASKHPDSKQIALAHPKLSDQRDVSHCFAKLLLPPEKEWPSSPASQSAAPHNSWGRSRRAGSTASAVTPHVRFDRSPA